MSSIIVAVMVIAMFFGMTPESDEWICAYHPPSWVDAQGAVHYQTEAYMCVRDTDYLMIWGDADGIVVGFALG